MSALARDARGAAAVEFVVAMVPLFLTLFCFMQVGKMYTANIVFQHAATIAARSAAVIVQPDINPGDNGSESDVKDVARLALGAWQTAVQDLDVQITTEGSGDDVNGMVTATLTGNFACGVAMGASIVCGLDHLAPLKATARFPLQGARYRMDPGASSETAIGDLPGSSGKTVCDPSSPFHACAP